MKILAVDDHPLIQEALRQVLRELDQDIVLIDAACREQALQLARQHTDCTLVLLDLDVPGACGMNLLKELRAAHPSLPVVVLSASSSRATVLSAIDCGAMGFIPKAASPRLLVDALRQILQGKVYLPPALTDEAAADAQGGRLGLSPRQRQVLALIVRGLPNKLICRELQLAEGTVKVHVSAVLKALGVDNRTQAVIAVSRLGLRLLPDSGTGTP
jgi:DNA-binding NarL/FixJ family response regulator